MLDATCSSGPNSMVSIQWEDPELPVSVLGFCEVSPEAAKLDAETAEEGQNSFSHD
jgi:hypothetical protein